MRFYFKCYIASSFCKLFAQLTFELWLAFSNNGPLIIIIIMMFALKCCILITLFCFEWWFTVRLLSNYIAIWTNCGILPAATVQRLLLTTTTQKEETDITRTTTTTTVTVREMDQTIINLHHKQEPSSKRSDRLAGT